MFTESSVKSFSSCFSLNQQQKQDFIKNGTEIKRIDSADSLFTTYVSKSIQKEEQIIIKSRRQPKVENKKDTFMSALTVLLQKADVPNSYIIRVANKDAIQDIAHSGKMKIMAVYSHKPLPRECESFIFAYPIADFSETVQEEIVVQLNPQLSSDAKKPLSKPFPRTWVDAMANQRNAQTTFNKNIMADGVIYQQLQMPYSAPGVQNVFNQTLKLLQTYETSLSNIDVSNLSQHIDQLNNLLYLDQGCQLCRNLAVRRSLLAKCAGANRQKVQMQPSTFIYQPTRDF